MRQFYLSPVILVTVVVLAVAGYLHFKPSPNSGGSRWGGGATVVSGHTVTMKETTTVIEGLGTARANESVDLSVQQSGLVKEIYFDDGEQVKAGKLLLKLVSQEEDARLKALNIRLAEAQRQLVRITNLAQTNVASEQLLDEQQGQVKVLKADIDVVKSQLNDLNVFAPFDGVLGYRQISVGALVRPGDSITTLDDISLINIDFPVSEKYFSAVSRGLSVTAEASAAATTIFTGIIASVDSRIDPTTRSFVVRAELDNSERLLRPGMLLNITLLQNSRQSLQVPESALVPINDSHFVYLIDADNTAVKTVVEIGQRSPGWVEIINGVKQGDVVVVEGAMKLRPGSKVSLLNNQQER